jgi:copper chaperone
LRYDAYHHFTTAASYLYESKIQLMLSQIYIDNLKCAGCASTIVTELEKLSDVQKVQIDREHDLVLVETTPEFDLGVVKHKLKSLGYPEKDSVQGFEKLSTHAKSYMSCAIGKMHNIKTRQS